ncbi:endonuclease MutS2 [Candidatus Binatia bacterium]|nr:endonuclease MutS2 [Candidatus Binatia bacterium]
MRPRDLAALELDRVGARLADFAHSIPGKERCRELKPLASRDAAVAALDEAWQAVRLIEEAGDLPLGEFPDIRITLRRASHEGFVLDGPALIEVRAVVQSAATLRAFLLRHAESFTRLAGLPERLRPLPALRTTLERALDERGEVTDDASDELAEVRRTVRQLREQVTRRLDRLLERPSMTELAADKFVTLRNNRFVIPIRTAVAGRFQGVVQDRSVSGETTFVEPLFAVELNNRLLLAAKEEERLVRRILADLTELVRDAHEALAETFAALTDIDVLSARARFARQYRCTQPLLDDAEVDLRAARHPGLLFTERPVTPIDLRLPCGKRVLVVTGPNTGGKTVALKTLGLLTLMAQSGLLVPAAEGSRLPYVTSVYADVGDDQSIERNLSTFSAHVANLAQILAADLTAALVLLDEPGVGTDPEEGAALGIALIRALAARGARVAVTTHYAALKVFGLTDANCVTTAVDFDVERLQPLYRMTYHSVGESLALPIARRLGLPAAVLDAAEHERSADARALSAAMTRLESARRTYEERLAAVEQDARAAAAARAEAERLQSELLGKRQHAWQDELESARSFVRDLRAEGREMIARLERGQADRRALERLVRAQDTAVRERAAAVTVPAMAEPVPAGPPRAGDEVVVGDRGIRGQLLSVDGDRAWIQRGNMRFEVATALLRRVEPVRSVQVAVRLEAAPAEAAPEISLIGMRVREAIAALDGFLDRAAQTSLGSVRIIHGIGSGALRRAVAEYLSMSPYCVGFRSGEANEGGAGVTIAELASG